jgi:dihydrofolate synthase/folylpolyglutamate synthase
MIHIINNRLMHVNGVGVLNFLAECSDMTAVERMCRLPLYGKGPCVSRMATLLQVLVDGMPSSIKVAGSNGKTSTCAMAAQILGRHGLKVGLYTSPHLIRINERFRIDGVEIDSNTLERVAGEVWGAVESVAPGEFGRFEFFTATAALWFAQQAADVCVWEAGIGGQLDATQPIPPAVTVLVNVSREHTGLLGETVEEIGVDKAGLAHPGTVLIVGRLQGGVRTAIDDHFGNALKVQSLGPQAKQVTAPSGLPGTHQHENAMCAFEACHRWLGDRFDPATAQAAIDEARWPGRFQQVSDHPTVILDAAHNPGGIQRLVETVEELGMAPVVVVVAVDNSKPYAEMMTLLEPITKRFLCTGTGEGTVAPKKLAAAVTRTADVFTEWSEALDTAIRDGNRDDQAVIVTGSHRLVGRALNLFAG